MIANRSGAALLINGNLANGTNPPNFNRGEHIKSRVRTPTVNQASVPGSKLTNQMNRSQPQTMRDLLPACPPGRDNGVYAIPPTGGA
jgi:hypothetical protein